MLAVDVLNQIAEQEKKESNHSKLLWTNVRCEATRYLYCENVYGCSAASSICRSFFPTGM